MTNVHLLRVFTDQNDDHGNPASVVIDEEQKLDYDKRLALTQKLHQDETVFVNKLKPADVRIFNPQEEVRFAGHAMVGTAWLLSKLRGETVETIHCLGGDIQTWQDHDTIWVRASMDIMPPWNCKQLDSPEEVEALTTDEMKNTDHIVVWAWINEAKGQIRARTFANDWDIPEAQGNGSGSMMLAVQLNKELEIKHGEGSIIYAKPAPNNSADIGGRVVYEREIIV